jgi:hypothetical protein
MADDGWDPASPTDSCTPVPGSCGASADGWFEELAGRKRDKSAKSYGLGAVLILAGVGTLEGAAPCCPIAAGTVATTRSVMAMCVFIVSGLEVWGRSLMIDIGAPIVRVQQNLTDG